MSYDDELDDVDAQEAEEWRRMEAEYRQRNEPGFWLEVAQVTGALRGCVMAIVGLIIYIGGFVALVAWGNNIFVLFLWLILGAPLVVLFVSLSATFALMPFAIVLVALGRALGWGEQK